MAPNNTTFAKKIKVPQKISKEFSQADKGKFKQGVFTKQKPVNIKPRGRG